MVRLEGISCEATAAVEVGALREWLCSLVISSHASGYIITSSKAVRHTQAHVTMCYAATTRYVL